MTVRAKLQRISLAFSVLAFWSSWAIAQVSKEPVPDAAVAGPQGQGSPWMAVPTLSVDPKLGTSLGALIGYVHYFDAYSPVSLFAVTGQYTSTDSFVYALAGKASFALDRQRVLALLAGGTIKNDYADYLGTGIPLHSSDELNAIALRYLYCASGDSAWICGHSGRMGAAMCLR